MRALIPLLLLLAGCATVPPPSPAAVPADILACKAKKLADVPARDLNDKEVEDGWSDNRASWVEKDKCLGRLIAGNQAAARKRGGP